MGIPDAFAESGQVCSGLISVGLVDVWLQRLLKANQQTVEANIKFKA